ncbi:hypothetical protein HPB48_011435 [Haemaphysalis longicornis]|uniref:Uncharacterized protein n=1 Tax=Haemaphysalis longicornis TaxID=44386 RepID=A0A9J6G808_HAELO|nr:hypothetical protein HPB48_011435 [Haemaphysalis longicornis]
MATARQKQSCPPYLVDYWVRRMLTTKKKSALCDGVDPYTCAGTDTTAGVKLLLVTTHADIVNYLVLSTSYVSLPKMKAYSLEAHNYFTSGRVSSMTAMRLPPKRVIMLSKVRLYFKIISIHIRESQTCTQRTNVWLPAHRSGTEYKRLRDIDFASLKKKKSHMGAFPERSFDEQQEVRTEASALRPPTAEELSTFYSNIDDGGLPPAIFMVLTERVTDLCHPEAVSLPTSDSCCATKLSLRTCLNSSLVLKTRFLN